MRILHVIQERRGGGAERVVEILSDHSRRAGHEVTIAAHGEGADHQLPLIRKAPWRIPPAVRALRRAVERSRPHVIHAHNPGVGMVTSLAVRRTVPALVTLHGVPDEDYRSAARLLAWTKLVVVSCGPGVTSALDEHGLTPAATIVNGPGRASPALDPAELRDMFGVPADHRLVATVGRLQPVKNQEVAIDALTHLERVSLLVIGEGPTRAKLASRAGELGLVERVVFTGYRDDPSALIGAVDALVITSKSEGTPLVALEAMAAGTPVIAADVRGLRGFLMHEQNALLVRVDDPVGLASAIERIVGDLSLAERLSHAGIALVARHDGAAMADSYLRLYAELAPGVGET